MLWTTSGTGDDTGDEARWFDPTEQQQQQQQQQQRQQPLMLDSTFDVEGDGGVITQPGH